MALTGKFECTEDLKAPADVHFRKWRKEAHHVPHAINHHIQGVGVHEGDWETHGSVKEWNYTCEGKAEKFKERTEFDDDNKVVKHIGVGGHPMEDMKQIDVSFGFTPKPEGGCIGKISLEYEKIDENSRTPTRYFELVKSMVKDMDKQLVKEE